MGSEPPPPSRSTRLFVVVAASIFAVVSALFVVKAALPAAFLLFLATVTVRADDAHRRLALIVAAVGGLFAATGMVRFTVEEAAPGIIQGGQRALSKSAVSRLRELLFAEDLCRDQAFHDPDGDGIGSALSLPALRGEPMRETQRKQTVLVRFGELAKAGAETVAIYDGYIYALFLPTAGGATTTESDAVDDELAERRFVAYGWPLHDAAAAGGGLDGRTVVFIDEHEHILLSDNLAPGQGYAGLDRIPRFDAALTGPSMTSSTVASGARGQDGGVWTAWKNKRPRASLPGDR